MLALRLHFSRYATASAPEQSITARAQSKTRWFGLLLALATPPCYGWAMAGEAQAPVRPHRLPDHFRIRVSGKRKRSTREDRAI